MKTLAKGEKYLNKLTVESNVQSLNTTAPEAVMTSKKRRDKDKWGKIK